jgi:hypothetical protein
MCGNHSINMWYQFTMYMVTLHGYWIVTTFCCDINQLYGCDTLESFIYLKKREYALRFHIFLPYKF